MNRFEKYESDIIDEEMKVIKQMLNKNEMHYADFMIDCMMTWKPALCGTIFNIMCLETGQSYIACTTGTPIEKVKQYENQLKAHLTHHRESEFKKVFRVLIRHNYVICYLGTHLCHNVKDLRIVRDKVAKRYPCLNNDCKKKRG